MFWSKAFRALSLRKMKCTFPVPKSSCNRNSHNALYHQQCKLHFSNLLQTLLTQVKNPIWTQPLQHQLTRQKP